MNGRGCMDRLRPVPRQAMVRRVFCTGNHPDGRQSYCGWKDNTGNFWMFGGIGNSNWGDLWEFDPAIKQWAWIGGSTQMDFPGSSGRNAAALHPFLLLHAGKTTCAG
jgi:hypothetical protein